MIFYFYVSQNELNHIWSQTELGNLPAIMLHDIIVFIQTRFKLLCRHPQNKKLKDSFFHVHVHGTYDCRLDPVKTLTIKLLSTRIYCQ